MTARQPVSSHSRSKTSGPMRRLAIFIALVVRDGGEHHRLAGEARARSQQPLQLPAFLQLLVPSKRGDHLLAHLVAVAAALDDLQIGAPG